MTQQQQQKQQPPPPPPPPPPQQQQRSFTLLVLLSLGIPSGMAGEAEASSRYVLSSSSRSSSPRASSSGGRRTNTPRGPGQPDSGLGVHTPNPEVLGSTTDVARLTCWLPVEICLSSALFCPLFYNSPILFQ